MQHQLIITAGPDQGRLFDVSEGQTLVIGRGHQSDTKITDAHMSRVHCEVRLEGGTLVVKDRGSSTGTFVAGERIEARALRPGERFRGWVVRVSVSRADGPG